MQSEKMNEPPEAEEKMIEVLVVRPGKTPETAMIGQSLESMQKVVDGLIESISEILGLGRQKTVILIGVGNLGRALMNNFNYFQNGFELIGAFDRSPNIVGTTQQGTLVRDASELRAFCMEHHPDVAVLTIPRESVHEIAGLLCDCGVKGIWNFTNVELHLEYSDVKVENVHLAESLMVLSYKLSEQER